jgi:hypothetical protein
LANNKPGMKIAEGNLTGKQIAGTKPAENKENR